MAAHDNRGLTRGARRDKGRLEDFYNILAPYYHLFYRDWEVGIARQGEQLAALITARWGEGRKTVLDTACGIGTQSFGLAQHGYQVTASDLSPAAIERAQHEARKKGFVINFSVSDMRKLRAHHNREFDVVICCDNALPHLLRDEEILTALKQMYGCTRAGGGCVISVRDYAQEPRGRGIIKPYGVREAGETRYLLFQVWDFEGAHYDLTMFLVKYEDGAESATTRVARTRYYAIDTDRLLALMAEAGFANVQRLDGVYFQPVLLGTRPLLGAP